MHLNAGTTNVKDKVIFEIRPTLVSMETTIIHKVHSNVVNALLKFITESGPDHVFSPCLVEYYLFGHQKIIGV